MDDSQFTPEQAASLVGGADCEYHYHSSDRQLNHDSVLQFQDNEGVRKITSSYTATYNDDFLFVDSTSGAISIQLPVARGGKSYTVVRIAGSNNVALTPKGTDKINGAASATISSSYSPLRLKSLNGVGWIQV